MNDEDTEARNETRAAERVPRRVTNPEDRAPIVLSEDAGFLSSSVIVPGVANQASVLRDRIRTIAGWPPAKSAVVEHLTSELFNNAIEHTRSGDEGGEVIVTVANFPGRIQVKMVDAGPRDGDIRTPHVRPLDLDQENGIGLFLVTQDSTRWGVLLEDGRTTVWFEIDHASKPG
ncbi:ATP-binding protein [Halostreptopolyspora alba]|uniref:ATP-binding protein n=1 Tax=Halostreptopolyspora alba TaxID=2487137 RepID=UPI00267D5597